MVGKIERSRPRRRAHEHRQDRHRHRAEHDADINDLVARQKQIIADSNGQVQLEEAVLLSGTLPAMRMLVSGMSESLSLLAIIDGHPVMLVGYGDLSRFDEVARTLRTVEP